MTLDLFKSLPLWQATEADAGLIDSALEFASLQMQIRPLADPSYSNCSPYVPGSITLANEGVVLHRAQCPSAIMRWLWIFDICLEDIVDFDEPETLAAPASHPHIVRLQFMIPAGTDANQLNGSHVLRVAACSEVIRKHFLQTVSKCKRAFFSRRCRIAASEALRKFEGSPQGKTPRREDMPRSDVPLHNTPRNSGQADLEMLAKLDANLLGHENPSPFELPQVWVCVSQTSRAFQRCSLVVDKLGVTVRPVMRTEEIPVSMTSIFQGASSVQHDGIATGELMLWTQAMTFPTSSIVDVSDKADKVFAKLKQPSVESLRLLRMQPFFRMLGPWEQADVQSTDAAVGEDVLYESTVDDLAGSDRESSVVAALKPVNLVPPTEYAVGLQVKGCIASNMQNPRFGSQAVLVVICCPTRQDSDSLAAAIGVFRMKSLSLAVRSYLTWREGSTPAMPDHDAEMVQSQNNSVSDPMLERPLLETPRASLAAPLLMERVPLHHSLLPRMSVTDEGEVLWYIPHIRTKQARAPPRKSLQRPLQSPDVCAERTFARNPDSVDTTGDIDALSTKTLLREDPLDTRRDIDARANAPRVTSRPLAKAYSSSRFAL